MDCSQKFANNIKKEYFQIHPETQTIIAPGPTSPYEKHIINLLEENPNRSSAELGQLANCHRATAGKIKQRWLKHQGKEAQSPQTLRAKYKTIIFPFLEKNPNHPSKDLAYIASCNIKTIHSIKRAWLQQQAEQGEPPDDESASAD